MHFHPTYFTNIVQLKKMLDAKTFCLEVFDNFQKQTYRNRCYILGANGKQLLNVPTQKVPGKQMVKDVKIDYRENWQKEHIKTLESAYLSSPFFEFYIDDLLPFFTNKETFLLDMNLKLIPFYEKILDTKLEYSISKEYQVEIDDDQRFLVNAKKEKEYNFQKYHQVFSNKHPFIENLSILDLIFNLGPNSNLYLEKLIIS